jgi:hypothetical protein
MAAKVSSDSSFDNQVLSVQAVRYGEQWTLISPP